MLQQSKVIWLQEY